LDIKGEIRFTLKHRSRKKEKQKNKKSKKKTFVKMVEERLRCNICEM